MTDRDFFLFIVDMLAVWFFSIWTVVLQRADFNPLLVLACATLALGALILAITAAWFGR